MEGPVGNSRVLEDNSALDKMLQDVQMPSKKLDFIIWNGISKLSFSGNRTLHKNTNKNINMITWSQNMHFLLYINSHLRLFLDDVPCHRTAGFTSFSLENIVPFYVKFTLLREKHLVKKHYCKNQFHPISYSILLLSITCV